MWLIADICLFALETPEELRLFSCNSQQLVHTKGNQTFNFF